MHDVDASRKEIRVLGKGNKVRSIPVTDDLLLAFKKYLHIRATVENVTGSALFVSENGKPIYDKMIYNIVRRKLSGFTTLSKKARMFFVIRLLRTCLTKEQILMP
ncbi:MAG: tyrosine-type recombinase/integrase [Saprospiraceae bacterium]|nr:tyrosine-type recombinase/integrase [Saprospiraceae bacterium]